MKILRKIMSFLLILALVIGLLPAPFGEPAEVLAVEEPTGPTSGTCGDNITWELTEDTEADWDLVQGKPYKLTLTGSGEMWNFNNSYNDNDIPWYEYSSMITSISIAEGITTVGRFAFCECVSLKSIMIPDSVLIIGRGAFYECYQLEIVVCGEGLETIEGSAFLGCSALQDITLPDSVTNLGGNAFGRTGLTHFTVPKNVIPDTIGMGILYGNRYLQSIQVAEGNPYFAVLDNILYEMKDGIPYRAIACAYASLGSEISIAEGTEIINGRTFDSAKITSMILPDTLKSIEYEAFRGCRLKEVNIPDSVESIDNSAFMECNSLAKVMIGKSLRKLEARYSRALAIITVSEENPYLDVIDNVLYNKEHTHLYVYASAKPNKEYQIPDTVESISACGISYTSNLETLYIPENINNIPFNAISDNLNLQDIYFKGNAPILDSPYSICDNADNLIIYRTPDSTGWDDPVWSNYTLAKWYPRNPTQDEGTLGNISWNYEGDIGRISFTGKGDLPDFTEENPAPWSSYVESIQKIETHGISGIGNYAFSNAIKLLRLETDAELKRIGDYAFSDCGKLMYFDIAATEVIGTGAFQNAVSIRDPLTLEKVSSIGSGAFQGCMALTEAILGNCLVSLEEDVFRGCTALNSLIIPESVTDIKAGALKDCTSLRTINIPASVDVIGTQVFSGDAALEKVYFYGDIPRNWSEDSFTGCSGDLTLYYRKTQTEWEQLNGSWNGLNLVGLDRFYTEGQDHYSFANRASSFGYQEDYRVPRQRYVDVLDSIATGTYYYAISKYWRGSSYGMAATTLEFYENREDSRFQIKNYTDTAQTLYNIERPSTALTKLIEGYQISQYKPSISGFGGAIRKNMGDYREMIQKVEEFERSGGLRTDDKAEPIIMVIYSVFGANVVIPVSVDQADNGDFLLKVYDPNAPSSLQPLTIYRDFSGISYGMYTYASYVDYTVTANAMSGIQLHDNTVDGSIYLSIDKEKGTVVNAEGKTIDEIEGAYEQKPLNGKGEDDFSGIRSFVLPEGNYKFTAKEDESAEETKNIGEKTETQENVTFYLASADNCAEITSSDKEAVLEVQGTDTQSGGLEIKLQSESKTEGTSSLTLVNQQGMERTIEVESANTAVMIAQDNTITVQVPTDETVSIDGKKVETENGQAVSSFEASAKENPFKAGEFETSVICDKYNKLSGNANATVISNAASAKVVAIKAEYFDKNGKEVASYSEKTTLNGGLNKVSLSFESLATAFEQEEGDTDLSCRLTVTDENNNSVVFTEKDIKVTLTKQPDNTTIPVENVTVNSKQVTLGVGESFQLETSVVPENASDKAITFESSDDNIIVSETGLVTANKIGSSNITVKSSNGKYVVVQVNVKKAPNKITLNAQKKTLKIGKSFQIKVSLPKDTASNKITYSSDKMSVASVSSAGKVTAKKKGAATITVKTFNGKTAKLKITVSNGVDVKKVTAKTKKLILGVGESFKLETSVSPINATNKKLTFQASNNKVTVNSKGKITAKKAGDAKITVKSINGKKAVVKVTVKKAPKKITLNAKKKTLRVGKSYKIKATLPKNTASNKIIYSSSKKSVASVSSSGKVKGKKKGTATITVKTFNGKKATLKIIVR